MSRSPITVTRHHELSHVLSIDDFQSGACVTLQGVSMQYPCANEIAFIRDHYGL